MSERYMGFNPEQTIEESPEAATVHRTEESVRRKAELSMKICKEVHVEGKEELAEFQEKHPNEKFILAGSHFTGLDVHAAVSELGDRFDIQVTGESTVKDQAAMRFLISLIGQDRFSDLEFRKAKDGSKQSVFNPENFDRIAEVMEKGRTPWMAVHPYTRTKEMLPSRVGSAYLAQKTDSWVVPTALLLEGGSMNLETPMEQIKQVVGRLRGKTKAFYNIGEPIKLPPIENLNVIGQVINKRAIGEKVTQEEKAEFRRVHQELREQADQIAAAVAALLPEEFRGAYSGEKK